MLIKLKNRERIFIKQMKSNLFGPIQIEYALLNFSRQGFADVFTCQLLVSIDPINKEIISAKGADFIKGYRVKIFSQGLNTRLSRDDMRPTHIDEDIGKIFG